VSLTKQKKKKKKKKKKREREAENQSQRPLSFVVAQQTQQRRNPPFFSFFNYSLHNG
jgi:hypothetical protein